MTSAVPTLIKHHRLSFLLIVLELEADNLGTVIVGVFSIFSLLDWSTFATEGSDILGALVPGEHIEEHRIGQILKFVVLP
jgi:ABC-type uncharacterized transport system permease subunit